MKISDVQVPKAVYRVLVCPACGAGLFRGPTGWVCPEGLDHTKVIWDETVRRWVAEALKMEAWAEGLTPIFKRVLQLGRANEIPAAASPVRRRRKKGATA